MFVGQNPQFRFVETDITTGGQTFIGALPTSLTGMTYDTLNARLVGQSSVLDQYFSIDPATAGLTLIGSPGGNIVAGDLAYDPDTNVYWRVDQSGEIFRVDSTTFVSELILETDISFYGAVYLSTPDVIPEPASWALMIAGFGLVGGAMRRRQAIAA